MSATLTKPSGSTPSGPTPSKSPPRKLRAARARKQIIFRVAIVTLVVLFFFIPVVSLLDFSTRLRSGGRNWVSWEPIVNLATADDPASKEIRAGLLNSLGLVAATLSIMLLLLIPTMTWIRLRVPGLRRPMEFICLLPLTIPAIVLVVGLAPIYRVLSNLLSTGSIWLCFVYAVLVLPFAYRSLDAGLDAIDMRTLSEAARSLGSSWGGVLWNIVLPNIKTAIISACFISLALVLGEFTVANLLARKNLQTAIFIVGQNNAKTAAALALVAMAFGFVLLFVFSFFGNSRKGRKARS